MNHFLKICENPVTEYLDTIFRLSDLESEWMEMDQKLKIGRHGHISYLVPNEITNCELL